MKKVVLIIDDHEGIREVLSDRIESMGYDHEQADSQNAATELLRKRRFDLILLDQELPVRKGKPTNKQVGRNLLAQIREEGLNQKTPVMIVTGHDSNDPMVACDFMRNGADYFLPKIMLEHLEAKIREVFSKPLAKNGKAALSEKTKPALKPFPGGKLTIREEGIFIDDLRLASTATTIGRILRELCKRTSSGKRRAQSCKVLAETLNLTRGDKAVAEAVSPFRKTVIEKLREAGFATDEDAVIARGRGGYELAAIIEVDSNVVIAEASKQCNSTPEERQQWFLTQAKEGKKPSKAIYMKRFRQSESTWKRDLKGITPLLDMVGTGAGAYYRPKNRPLGGSPQ